MEIYTDVVGYENKYKISNYGNIISFAENKKEGKPMKNSMDDKGYYYINLYKDDKQNAHAVSRLVGFAFVENPENKPEIDHINRIRHDNYELNLRWATRAEQMENRDVRDTNKAGVSGVIWCPRANKWRVNFVKNKVQWSLGHYDNVEEAIKVRRKAEQGEIKLTKRVKASNHPGIGFDKERNKWTCYKKIDGKRKYIGRFNTEKEAIDAYNKN